MAKKKAKAAGTKKKVAARKVRLRDLESHEGDVKGGGIGGYGGGFSGFSTKKTQ